MQVLERLKIALILMKDSLAVMRHNPKLMLFPILSGIAGIAFLAVFLGTMFGVLAIDFGGDAALLGVILGTLLVVYLGTTFISAFFTAALVHQTRDVLAGEQPSIKAGMRGAWDVKGPLLAWAAIAATVGVILNAIQDSNSAIGRVLGTLFGIAWTLMTFFIIPVIVFEQTSIRGMFKESARTFKETWGETPLSIAGVGLLSFLAAAPFAIPGIMLADSGGYELVGFALIAIGIALGAVLSHTFKGIIKTSLYFYATEGTMPDEFEDVDVEKLKKDDDNTGTSSVGTTTGGFQGR